jgi:hypothetical protein
MRMRKASVKAGANLLGSVLVHWKGLKVDLGHCRLVELQAWLALETWSLRGGERRKENKCQY